MSGELVAPVYELRRVGYEMLPEAAGNWGALTKYVANVGEVGPAGALAAELARAAYEVFAETADRLYDSAVAVCKIANGYELTDNLNNDKMPKGPGIEPQTPVNPKLKTL
ncbi:hypothetical protein Afil01_23090 [Actinorhabdospora filicis]|uniref:Uncharacterized protein n=1 Tax=Actinorhabdospora filicis TaxID=1785913 RepID=A0A9W6SKA3_9ACTN|nr:hypothetical protein [Actinorhabdospora filicis]GLZ77502.1 hypothetical protein Afil01_23090 [Actinorhabdospora filicis]